MKKGILCMLFAVLALFALAGCARDGNLASGNTKKAEVALNKKYVFQEDIALEEGEQTYFVFTDSDEGYFHYYYYYYSDYQGTEEITEYTVYFKYYIVDDMLTCFFDSVEYGEKHTEEKDQVKTYWKDTLAANKNYLMNMGGNYYVNVDFLENEIPNYGK